MAQLEELAARMLELDENQLVLRLGMAVKEISEDLEVQTRSTSIDSIDISTPIHTRDEDILNFGQRLFKRLNSASYELLCKEPFDDGETLKKLVKALEDSADKAAALLAPVLVANLGLAPVIAAIVAALIIKTVSKVIADEICDTWKQNLEASESSIN